MKPPHHHSKTFRTPALSVIVFALTTIFSLQSSQASWETDYNFLLKKYATSSGVKYRQWNANASDKAKLTQVLKEMAKIDARQLKKNDRAAFRINLYNASMLKVALDHYPLKSVTRIGLIPFSVFKKKNIITPNGKISLNTLEKKQLIIDFPDPRIHFAINCASKSCPPLRSSIYTGKNINAQLNEQAKQFANSHYAVQIDKTTAYYSELFKWYEKDFHTKDPGKYLNRFRREKLPTNLKIDWQKYDWSLNESN